MARPCTTARKGDASLIQTPVVLGVLYGGVVHAVVTGFRYPNGEILSFYLMCRLEDPRLFDPNVKLVGGPVVGGPERTTCLRCLLL